MIVIQHMILYLAIKKCYRRGIIKRALGKLRLLIIWGNLKINCALVVDFCSKLVHQDILLKLKKNLLLIAKLET